MDGREGLRFDSTSALELQIGMPMTDAASGNVDPNERNERLLNSLEQNFTTFPAMLHSIDTDGRLIAVSDVWLKTLGYSREEVLGRRSSEFLTAESQQYAIREILPEFFRTGCCVNVEYQMVCKDGRLIDVLVSAVMVSQTDGLRCSLALITDVTARKAAERQLAESEARYRGLIEDQSEFVSLAGPDGVLRFVNHAYARLHLKHPDEMIGTNLFDYIPTDGRAAVAKSLDRLRDIDEGAEHENQVILPDGRTRWVAWTNRASKDAAGEVVAIHSVGRDVERRVVAEQRLRERKAAYRLLADNSTDMILLVRQDGTRTYASPACRTLLGYEPEEMLAMTTRDAIHPEDLPMVWECLSRSKEECVTLVYRMRRKDGSYLWVESVTRAIEGEPGQSPQRLVVSRDIEKRIAAEQKLKESEARYRLLAEHGTDMVFQLDLDLVRRYVSPACREILGYEPEDLIGAKPLNMVHPEDVEHLTLVLRSLLWGDTDRHSAINRIRHKDGRWVWVEARFRTLRDDRTGAPCGIIGALRDISDRKAVEDQLATAYKRLEVLAREDGLTGLANRRAFDDAFSREYKRARRNKKHLGLLLIDVDCFKLFNDRYGHQAGDECLRQVSVAIAEALHRPSDMAARYGGEEFVVLLPDTDEAGAAMIGERIRSAIRDLKIEHRGSAYHKVTVSVGVAAAGREAFDRNSGTLLRHADLALYCAKATGRNAVVRASDLPSSAEYSFAAA